MLSTLLSRTLFPRTLAALTLVAGLAAQQQLNLPDNHHLSESPTQLANVGSGVWWRTAAGRFQIVYEASNFTGTSGVTGPIVITKLRFRGEDAEVNLGGQVYAGVNVTLGSTSLTAATLGTSFAGNRAPALPNTTTMGITGVTNVTLLPSAGSVPNNWNIEIDLGALGSAFAFDPTSAEPNLLIDIDMPTAPSNAAPLGLIFMQNTLGTPAAIRGAGVSAAGAGAAAGTLNANPLVVGLEFLGTGGFTTLVPARNELFGGACGGAASSFYQSFVNGQPWDLSAGLTLTPDNPTAPNTYTVALGSQPFDATKINATANTTLDDALVAHPLGFTFNYPGGSTIGIQASTNGFLWLDSSMTDTQFAGVVSRLLGDGVATATQHSAARFALYWHDLNCGRNLAINPSAGLHVLTDTSGGPGNAVCYVTWRDISEFNVVNGAGIAGHAVWNFQCVMYEATGVVEYRYGSMPAFVGSSGTTLNHHAAIVGFSRGRIGGFTGINSVDPQSRDLSLEPTFQTSIEGTNGNIGQTAVATPAAGGAQYNGRMFPGQSVTWNATNVPPSTILAVQLIDIAASRPGIQFPTITAPGCMFSLSTTSVAIETFVTPAATVTGTAPLVVPPGFDGTDIYAQFLVLDGLFTGADLITAASNTIRHTIGQN